MVAVKTNKKSTKINNSKQNKPENTKKEKKMPEPVLDESESESMEEEMPAVNSQKTKKSLPEMSTTKKQKFEESGDEIDDELSDNMEEEGSEESENGVEDESDDDIEDEEDDSDAKDDSNGEIVSDNDNDSPVSVMLGNLSSRTSEDDLRDMLTSSSIKYSKLQRKERTATLTVMAGSLQKIIDLIGTPLNNRKLSVLVPEEATKETSPQNMSKASAGEENCCVFVKNLDYNTTNESLQEAFEGSVSARVIIERDTGRSKGFGYVDFETHEEAKCAIENVTSVDGRNVYTDFAVSARGSGGPPRSNDNRGGFRGGRDFRGGSRGGRGRGFSDFRGGRGGSRGGRGFGDFRGRGDGFRGGRGQAKHFTFDE